MAYDLEEQEQLAALKAWWKDNGAWVVAALAAAVIAAGGWQGWRLWQAKQGAEAGALYESLARAMQAGDGKALREAGGALAEGYPRSLYASMGALAAARFHFERGDLKAAAAQLQWVIERSPSDDLRELARLRLAGVRLDEKAFDEALKLLEAKHSPSLAGPYAALRGDVLLARDRREEARAAYKLALEKSDGRPEGFRESVRLRLEALGS